MEFLGQKAVPIDLKKYLHPYMFSHVLPCSPPVMGFLFAAFYYASLGIGYSQGKLSAPWMEGTPSLNFLAKAHPPAAGFSLSTAAAANVPLHG